MKDATVDVNETEGSCEDDQECRRLIHEITMKANEAPESTLEIISCLGKLVKRLENTTSLGSAFLFKVVPHVGSTIFKALVIAEDENKTPNVSHEIIEVVSSYMRHLNKCLKEDFKATNVERVNGLLIAILTVARDILNVSTECKREEADPSTEKLAVPMQLVFEIIVLAIAKLDDTQFGDDSEAGVLEIVSVSTCLLDICKLWEKMIANKPAILLWKAYSKIVVTYSNTTQDRVNISEAFRSVITKITYLLATITNLLANAGKAENAVGQSLIHCNFFVKMLARWCQSTKLFEGDVLQQMHRLVLDLYRFSASTLATPNLSVRLESQLDTHVAEPMKCLLAQLFAQIEYQTLVLKDTDHDETEESYEYAWCQLYLYILENLHELPDLRHSSLLDKDAPNGLPLIDRVLTWFCRCFKELALPIRLSGVMCQGKPLRRVSFYEHTCVRLCAAIVELPEEYFSAVEIVLLKNVLGNQYWSSLLASDVWTFLCRLESSELCYHHCCCLAELVKHSAPFSRDAPWCLYLTFQRLLSLLADKDKKRFVRLYPVDENPIIWMHVPTDLAAHSQINHSDPTVKATLAANVDLLNRWKAGDDHSSCATKFSEMMTCICALRQLDATDSISAFSSCLNLSRSSLSFTQNRNDLLLLTDRLNLCIILQARCLIPSLTNEQLGQMLRLMMRLTCQCSSDAIACGILKFLRCLGHRTLVMDSKARELFIAIAELLKVMLSSSNWIIFEQALETFQVICQATPHVEIIQVMRQVLIGSPKLNKIVQNFMDPEAMPWKCSVKEYSALDTVAFQQDLLKTASVEHETRDVERSPEYDQRVQSLVADMGAKVAELQNVSRTSNLSAASKEELNRISTVILTIIDTSK